MAGVLRELGKAFYGDICLEMTHLNLGAPSRTGTWNRCTRRLLELGCIYVKHVGGRAVYEWIES